jgi:hypothetical protein
MISNRIVQKNRVVSGGNNNLWGWGDNTNKMIENTASNPILSPIMTDKYGGGGTLSWNMVSSGKEFACGIDTNNKLYCWGLNSEGQLGDGTTTNSVTPVPIVAGGSWKKVYCGTDHVLALNSSDKLFSWGRNNAGQLGDGTTTNRSSPVAVGSDSWIKVSAGHRFSAGIKYYTPYKGTLYTWGLNDQGQLGDGTQNNRSNPTKITYGSYPDYMWDNITTGYKHCLATAKNYFNDFLAWGLNDVGQLGNGSTNNSYSPTRVTTPSGGKIYVLEAGGSTSAIIDASYKLYTFGDNTRGQIGNNMPQLYFSSPQYILYGATQVQIAAKTKANATTFIISETKIYSWGYASAGILGDGTTVDKSSPVQIGAGKSWIDLSKTGGIGNITMFAKT